MYRGRRAQPPPKPHGLALASPGARLVARLIDFAVLTGLALVANGWFLYRLFGELGPMFRLAARGIEQNQHVDTVRTLLLLMAVVSAAIWLAYEVPAIANTGQTLGKRLMQIKVVRLESPDRMGFGRSLGRWSTLGLPTLLWPCLGIGVVMQVVDCLFVVVDTPLRQALHDRRSHTVVVQVGQSTAGPAPTGPRRPGETHSGETHSGGTS